MELRTAASPRDVKNYTTERLREEFLIDDLFQPDVIKLVYSHIDRIITGSAVPVKETLYIQPPPNELQLYSITFPERNQALFLILTSFF